MIIVYPMLVSENTNMNMIPPICKILEKYILVYRMEDVMGYMRYLSVPAAFLNTKESLEYSLTEAGPGRDPWEGTKPGWKEEQEGKLKGKEKPKSGNPPKGDDGKGGKDGKGKAYEDRPLDIKLGEVNIDTPRKEDITLEPTWVKMSHPKLGSILVGIKVIPFKVTSEYNYIHYLLNDIKSKFIESKLESMKRKFIRLFWMFAGKLPFMSKTLTGDPSKDVFFASTVFKHNVFCLFNYMDLEETDLLKSPANVAKLFDMGWNSLVIADDVNKRVTFCMKEFHGLCSPLNYGYIQSSFGRDYAKTFESIEDVRKAASPFFRLTTSVKKLLSMKEGKMKDNKIFNDAVANYLTEIYNKEDE